MLINLHFNFDKVLESKICFSQNDSEGYTYIMSNPQHKAWAGDNKSHCVFYIKKHENGIYEGPLTFEQDISQYIGYNIVDYTGFIKKNGIIYEHVNPNDDNFVLSYGLSDDLEQIKMYYKELIENPNHKYIIAFTQITTEEEYKRLLLDYSPYINYIGSNPSLKKFTQPLLTFKIMILKEEVIKTVYQKHILVG